MDRGKGRNKISHTDRATDKEIAQAGIGKKYLSKRILLRAASKSLKAAAAETMRVQGYTVVAEHGWVVKVYADGIKEQVKRIEPIQRPAHIRLR